MRRPRRTEIGIFDGRLYDLAAPDASMIEIDDVARALDNIARFTGHTGRHYSVAEHSIHVMRCALELAAKTDLNPRAVARAGLMHDAAETVIGDIATPLKHTLGLTSSQLLRANELEFERRFGIIPDQRMRNIVQQADYAVFLAEARHLIPGAYWARGGWQNLKLFKWYESPRKIFLAAAKKLGIQ